MIKSSKQLAIVLALATLGAPFTAVRAQSRADLAPTTGEASHEDDDGFFPELAQDSDGLSSLERAAREILVDHAAQASLEGAQLDFTIKGIFEKGSAWRSASIPVCFVDPASELGLSEAEFVSLARSVSDVARAWNRIEGISKFDFGPGDTVRRCVPGVYSVAVQFTLGPSQSLIGRRSYNTARAGIATMDLQLSQLRKQNEEAVRQLVLHEFGHALGLLHEFNHADGRCWSKLDETKLYAFYAEEYGIAEPAKVRSKLATYDPAQMLAAVVTPIDGTSVMMYSFPARIYRDPSPPCRAGVNSQISDGDIETVQRAYRSPALGMMQLAAIGRDLPENERRVIDALIAVQMASEPVREQLVDAIDRLSTDASPTLVADTVFKTAHSPLVQSMMESTGQ